ncbi:MAG: hypothetical protein Tsb009_07130 [Planctomycetaceae bacterium]
MLEIYGLGNQCLVTVEGMEGYLGVHGVWHFKTKRPLVPGVPHIYTVRAHVVRNGVLCEDVRVVRLIRGRIVTLNYGHPPRLFHPHSIPRPSRKQ